MSESGVPGSLVDAEEEQSSSGARRMVLNMGPQHPSTHGVLRLLLELDGENIVTASPTSAFCTPASRSNAKSRTISRRSRLTDRVDYLAPLSKNLG